MVNHVARGAVALAAVIALTACGTGAQEMQEGGKANTAASLNFGVVGAPDSLDPHMATSELNTERFGLYLLYDRLFSIDSKGKLKGELVKTWSYSSDGTVLTLTLRDGVTFHDGTPLDAAAVEANLDRARTLDSPVVKDRMSVVKRVAVADDATVKLTLTGPYPHVPDILVECAGLIMNPKLIKSGDPSKQVDGSGPYEMTAYVPGESITVERSDDDYWKPGLAKIKTVKYQEFADPQAYANAVRSGSLDVGQYLPDQAKSLYGDSNLQVETVDQGISSEIIFNRNVKPLDDKAVRQAMNFAIDRKALVKAFWPRSKAKWQYYREGLAGHDASVGDIYSYDPARAKRLLAQAGYSDGVDLGTILVSSAATPGLADVIQEQLAAVGIKSSLRLTDVYQLTSVFAEGKVAANIGFTVAGTSPYTQAIYRWGGQAYNPAGTDAGYDRILAGATSRVSEEARDKVYAQLDRYVVENAWSVPIVWFGTAYAMKPPVDGIGPDSELAPVLGPIDLRYASVTQ